MAKIAYYLSAKTDTEGMSPIFARVYIDRDTRCRVDSGFKVRPDRFSNGKIKKPRIMTPEAVALSQLEIKMVELETVLYQGISDGGITDKESLEKAIADFHHKKPATQRKKRPGKDSAFHRLWLDFVKNRDISENRKAQYRSLERALCRFEEYRKKTTGGFVLSVDNFDPNAFINFYRDEWKLYDSYPDLYDKYPAAIRPDRTSHKPRKRGDNMIANVAKRLTAFFNWCVEQKHIKESPMVDYKGVRSETYGTPYYLTKEERNIIARYDLSSRPHLAKQRDVFIFQCLVGCRVSDLYSLERTNISGGMLQYIPSKTSKARKDVVRVPLTPTAKAILERYKDEERILPFISQQKYNVAIKEVCRVCGIDRVVTVINTLTGLGEQKPIWQVASSHMARRTFVGVLYKQVKDPNLVGSMSGHAEGSREFARYRTIDDELKQETINLLD